MRSKPIPIQRCRAKKTSREGTLSGTSQE